MQLYKKFSIGMLLGLAAVIAVTTTLGNWWVRRDLSARTASTIPLDDVVLPSGERVDCVSFISDHEGSILFAAVLLGSNRSKVHDDMPPWVWSHSWKGGVRHNPDSIEVVVGDWAALQFDAVVPFETFWSSEKPYEVVAKDLVQQAWTYSRVGQAVQK